MADLIEILISGLALGAIYALVGLSLNIVVVTSGVVNFAQGDIGMVAVMFTIGARDAFDVPVGVALLAGLALAAALAAVVDLVAVRPVERVRGPSVFGWMVSTLGASIVIQNGTAMIFGTNSEPFPRIVPGGQFSVAGATVTYEQLSICAIAAALVVVFAVVVRYTQPGRVARAIADNRAIAGALGVRTAVVRTGVVMASGVIVGVAAVFVAPQIFANSFIGTGLLLNGFVAIVLGGIGNIGGGLVGGLGLGVLYALTGRFAPSVWQPYVPFIALIAWITLRSLAGENVLAELRRQLTARPAPATTR